jgi:HK97 family phage major capsid protein
MPSAIDTQITSIEVGLKQFIEKYKGKSAELDARLLSVEQALVARGGGTPLTGSDKSLGATLTESDGFASFKKGARSSGQVEIGSFLRKAVTIVSGTWSSGPQFLPQVAQPPQPRLPVRQLMPNFPTTSALIEFPSEDSHSGAADYQVNEGDAKPQMDFAYSLKQNPVATIAVWLAASRQLLDDSQAFAGYIDQRLSFFVEQKIEHELLFGDGGSGHLRGICPVATVGGAPGANLLDTIAQALSSLAVVGVQPDGIVLHPTDWWNMRTLKAAGSGVYLLGDPLSGITPQVWGLRVSLSTQMPVAHYLVGEFATQAAIFDRMNSSVEVSREHSDFFVRNLIAILAEQRLALCVFRPDAFVYGNFGTGS